MRKILYLAFISALVFSACSQKTPNKTSVAKVVGNFDLNSFLGKWYVVGKIDPFMGENFINQEIIYSKTLNNGLLIDTKAYNSDTKKYVNIKMDAKFIYNQRIGALECKYPTTGYGPYNIVKVDSNYKYALVYGQDTKEIWFLSRNKTMPEVIKAVYEKYAKDGGYNIDNINWEVQRAK